VSLFAGIDEADTRNFYFLVKECGISPLDIPQMTPLQVQVLIAENNKINDEQDKERKRLEAKAKSRR
jgi:hypothetical protein